jgi:hypothetical protein
LTVQHFFSARSEAWSIQPESAAKNVAGEVAKKRQERIVAERTIISVN